jgi:hypothetical protein
MEEICSSLVEWVSFWSTTEQSAISILRMARLWILVASEKSQNDRDCWVGNQEKRRVRYEAGTSARFGILTDASMVGERNDSSAHAYREYGLAADWLSPDVISTTSQMETSRERFKVHLQHSRDTPISAMPQAGPRAPAARQRLGVPRVRIPGLQQTMWPLAHRQGSKQGLRWLCAGSPVEGLQLRPK